MIDLIKSFLTTRLIIITGTFGGESMNVTEFLENL